MTADALGVDLHPWALTEAAETYRHFGLPARTMRGDLSETTLPAGPGHWSSPIVTDGRIALPEGDANEHRTSGVLDIYRVS